MAPQRLRDELQRVRLSVAQGFARSQDERDHEVERLRSLLELKRAQLRDAEALLRKQEAANEVANDNLAEAVQRLQRSHRNALALRAQLDAFRRERSAEAHRRIHWLEQARLSF